MAYVLQFAPQDFCAVPKHGMIQYHPSLLPKYRGPSSINWPIIHGDTRTGLTIFRPSDGLDEGPVILQKETPIGPDDTLGSVYFDRLFPMGIEALKEAADRVVGGRASRDGAGRVAGKLRGLVPGSRGRDQLAHHIDHTYNMVRGCNPAPGAWTVLNGKKAQALRRAQAPHAHFLAGEGESRHHRLDRREKLAGERPGRPARGLHLAVRGWQEAERTGILQAGGHRGGRSARRLIFLAGSR